MLYLIIAALIVLAAPWFCSFIHRSPRVSKYMDWLISLYVVFAVLFHILPESFHIIHNWTVIIAGGSAMGFWLLEAFFANGRREMTYIVIAIAILGLFFHEAMDGAALAEGDHHHLHKHMVFAVIAHRLPVGMFVWMTLRKYLSWKTSYACLILMCTITVLGYFNSHLFISHAEHDPSFAIFQAIFGGALLHCIWHPVHKHKH